MQLISLARRAFAVAGLTLASLAGAQPAEPIKLALIEGLSGPFANAGEAVAPELTNEKCSFWHFRFDAHADMRLAALTDVLRDDASVKKLYLIGQDYSFGQQVLKQARTMVAAKRPDIEIVGDELHPLGRV